MLQEFPLNSNSPDDEIKTSSMIFDQETNSYWKLVENPQEKDGLIDRLFDPETNLYYFGNGRCAINGVRAFLFHHRCFSILTKACDYRQTKLYGMLLSRNLPITSEISQYINDRQHFDRQGCSADLYKTLSDADALWLLQDPHTNKQQQKRFIQMLKVFFDI